MDLSGTTFGIKTPMLGVLVLGVSMCFSIWRVQANLARLRERTRRNDRR